MTGIKLTDEWETLMAQVHNDPGQAAYFGSARPYSTGECVHDFIWAEPKRNEPIYARCAICGSWWFFEHPVRQQRRPIPWGCFKLFHVGRNIRLPLIDRAA